MNQYLEVYKSSLIFADAEHPQCPLKSLGVRHRLWGEVSKNRYSSLMLTLVLTKAERTKILHPDPEAHYFSLEKVQHGMLLSLPHLYIISI